MQSGLDIPILQSLPLHRRTFAAHPLQVTGVVDVHELRRADDASIGEGAG